MVRSFRSFVVVALLLAACGQSSTAPSTGVNPPMPPLPPAPPTHIVQPASFIVDESFIGDSLVGDSINVPFSLTADSVDTTGVEFFPCLVESSGDCPAPSNDTLSAGNVIEVTPGSGGLSGHFVWVFGDTGMRYINFRTFAVMNGDTVIIGNYTADSGDMTGTGGLGFIVHVRQ